MASWKEAGIVELELRQKTSSNKSDKRNFWISIAILIISALGLLVSIILKFIK